MADDDKIIHVYVFICTYTYIMSNRQIHRSWVVHCMPYLVYSVDPSDVSKSDHMVDTGAALRGS